MTDSDDAGSGDDAAQADAVVGPLVAITFTFTPRAYGRAHRGTVDRGELMLLALLTSMMLPIGALGLFTRERAIGLTCALIGLLTLYLLLDLQVCGPRRRYRERGLGRAPTTWEFSEDGVRIVHPSAVYLFPWNRYRSFVITDTYLRLERDYGPPDLAPIDVFDQEQLSVARSLLGNKLPRTTPRA